MLDFFVENLWEKLPISWKNFYGQELRKIKDRSELVNFVKWILRNLNAKENEKLNFIPSEPEPLSMISLRKVVHIVSLNQWDPIKRPSEVLSLIKFCNSEVNLDGSFTNLKTVLPSSLRLKIKNKKEHEITRIVDVVKILLENLKFKIDEIIDIGAGIGHLSRILSLLLPYKVSTIEGDSSLVEKASQIDGKVSRFKQYLNQKDNEDKSEFVPLERKNLFIKSEKEIHYSEEKDLFLTGLHTCGDFSSTIIRYFISNPNAKVILHFGCCYHKLNGGKDKIFKDVYKELEKDKDADMDPGHQSNSQGFPMSKLFSNLNLSYAAREVACFGHEQFIQKLTESLVS